MYVPSHLTAVPVLLPYKPCGSEELFYIPQTETDISSTNPSDTTMESSHTGTFVSNVLLRNVDHIERWLYSTISTTLQFLGLPTESQSDCENVMTKPLKCGSRVTRVAHLVEHAPHVQRLSP